MIFWNVLLSVLLLISLLFNVYILLEGRKNKKAIMEIICPELEIQKTRLIKLQKQL